MDTIRFEQFKKNEEKMRLYQKCFLINIGSSFTGNPNEIYTVDGKSISSPFLTYYAKIYEESFATTEEKRKYKDFRIAFCRDLDPVRYVSVKQKCFYEFINDTLKEYPYIENATQYFKESANQTEKKMFEKAYNYYSKNLYQITNVFNYKDRLKKTFEVFITNGPYSSEFCNLSSLFQVHLTTLQGYPQKYADKYATQTELIHYKHALTLLRRKNQKKNSYYQKIKKAFDTFIKYGPYSPEFINLSVLFQVQPVTTDQYPQKYASNYANKDELILYRNALKEAEKEKQDRKNLKNLQNYIPVFEKLQQVHTEIDIINVIESSKHLVSTIKLQLDLYINIQENLNASQKKELAKALEKKLAVYENYLNEIREEEMLERQEKMRLLKEKTERKAFIKAENCINEFVNSSFFAKDYFCSSKAISPSVFQSYLNLVKENNNSLYQRYLAKIEDSSKQRFSIIMKKVKTIVFYLKNGVPVNEYTTRPFDILDYYEMLKVPLCNLLPICKNRLDAEDLRLVRNFVKRNHDFATSSSNQSIEALVKIHREFNCQKNKNGLLIPGTGTVIAEKEKEKIIQDLKANEIPVNAKTYQLALNRYYKKG